MTETNKELAELLRHLAKKFHEGWHEGIEIDASDLVLLEEAAERLDVAPDHAP